MSLWHLKRMKLVADLGPDVFAVETIPVLKEAEAIIDNLSYFPSLKAWVTFQCKVKIVLFLSRKILLCHMSNCLLLRKAKKSLCCDLSHPLYIFNLCFAL